MLRRCKILSAIVAVLCSLNIFAEEYEYGLKVVTYPSPADAYTSLALDSGKLISAGRSTVSLKFDLFNRRDNVFGCVFRIITDKGDNIDLMYTADRNDVRYPILVCGENVTEVPAEIVFDRWIPVSISLDPRSGHVTLDYNGTKVSFKDAGTKGASGFRIAFGLCQFAGYSLNDVASCNLRQVCVFRGGKEIRHWTLSLHDDNQCLDELKKSPALTSNPSWLIDQYITWDTLFSASYDHEPSVAPGEDGVFYVTTDGSWIDRFSIPDSELTRLGTVSGFVPLNAPGQLMYAEGRLLAYNVDVPSFARFNRADKRWDGDESPIPESSYWNKTTSWWPEEKAVVSFGGYGFYHYNNELMIQYPYHNKADRRFVISEISPRYSSASAILGNTLYIFGGRGNVSGKQELSPRNYYDLYTVDLVSGVVNKLWEFDEAPVSEFRPGGNMVFDAERNCFYVLTSMEDGTLISISPDHPGYELMSLPTGHFRPAQYSDLNLWLSDDSSRLYGSVVQAQVDGKSTVNVFGINYPPINVDSLHQSVAENTKIDRDSSEIIIIILLFALLAAITLACIPVIGKRRKSNREGMRTERLDGSEIANVSGYYNFDKSSISFFGGFCVKDRNGEDITSLFTPTLKSLVALLILYHCKDSNGIISNKLNRTLWPYKPEDTANNNRNVYISKLRPILERIGDIRITCQNRFWNIQFGDSVFCDYVEALRLFRENSNEENISHLLELLLRGMMLPNMEYDWVDEFKSDFSSATIDFMSKQIVRKDLSENILIQACDTIFQHDFLNEDALRTKCRILYSEGKVGLAKSTYDNFCKEYLSSIGMEYNIPFKKIIS